MCLSKVANQVDQAGTRRQNFSCVRVRESQPGIGHSQIHPVGTAARSCGKWEQTRHDLRHAVDLAAGQEAEFLPWTAKGLLRATGCAPIAKKNAPKNGLPWKWGKLELPSFESSGRL